MPCNADIRCSIVAIECRPEPSVVPREVAPTLFANAGCVMIFVRSVRRKAMPKSSKAGFTVTVTVRPVCNPGPVTRNSFCIVF